MTFQPPAAPCRDLVLRETHPVGGGRVRHFPLLVAMFAIALLGVGPGAGTCAASTGLFDFETGDLQGWRIVKGAFGKVVSDRALFHNTHKPYNKQGKYYLTTLERADDRPDDHYTGIIESPKFRIAEAYLSFLVGGGEHPDTYVALCTADGKAVLRASGENTELMRRIEWDVRRWQGRTVFLRVVDGNTGSWGHVTLDDVRAETAAEHDARLARIEAARKAAEEQRRKAIAVRLSDPALHARGAPRVYLGETLTGVRFPVSGIGAGGIEIDGQARLTAWQIFNNFTQADLPNTFLAVRATAGAGQSMVRALQTAAAGAFPAMKELTLRAEYPLAEYAFRDPALPVRVTLETFNPLVPFTVRDSAIPCAVFRVTVTNPGATEAAVTILFSCQNGAGYTGKGAIADRKWKAFTGNRNRIATEPGAVFLHMTTDRPRTDPGFGDMALAVRRTGTESIVDAVAAWRDNADLMRDLADNGRLSGVNTAGPAPAGETLNGALAVPFRLAPGARRTLEFVLTWDFPNAKYPWGATGGNRYCTWYKNALDVARDVARRLPDLTARTRLYHDTFYRSNLPWWLMDRITSQLAVLRSKTCYWGRDGFFGGWEGCSAASGCCSGNCSHVWHYAQAHAALFPAIARRMREEALRFQRPDGGIPHRIPKAPPACDGQTGEILEAFREHLHSPNTRWLDEHWPAIRKAVEYAIHTWDADENGVFAGAQWNTLDCNLGGNSSWLGSLYLAALEAAEKMARLEKNPDAAQRYRRIRDTGARLQDNALWNGEYYIERPGPKPYRDYNNGCHIDQVLGVWWARQLDLPSAFPADRVRNALAALFLHSYRPDFQGMRIHYRRFVTDNDAGLLMITWPHGDQPRPAMRYYDEVMTGFEYAAAAAMIQAGRLDRGLLVVKSISDRYDGRLRTGVTGSCWGYTGNPFGDDECGKFYARAMSVWSVLLACQGAVLDGPAGRLGFRPVWQPDDHATFFTGPEGYGLFTQKRTGNEQHDRLELAAGRLRLTRVLFQAPAGRTATAVTATLNAAPIALDFQQRGRDIEITLHRETLIPAPGVLDLRIRLGTAAK